MKTLDEVKRKNFESIETQTRVYKELVEELEHEIKQFNPFRKADIDEFYHEKLASEIERISRSLSHVANSLNSLKRVGQTLDELSNGIH